MRTFMIALLAAALGCEATTLCEFQSIDVGTSPDAASDARVDALSADVEEPAPPETCIPDGIEEVRDDRDNDCDGVIDEDLP